MSESSRSSGLPDDPFDAALIDEHRRVFGADGSRRLVETFLASVAERLAALDQAMATGDIDAAHRTGHAIKGLGATAGAARLAAAGAMVQHAEPEDLADRVALVHRTADEATQGIATAWRVVG